MEFNTGWFTGCVLHYDETAKVSLIKFHVDSTTFHVKDKLHTFSFHPPPQRLPAPPPVYRHMTLSPVLLTVPRPLPPYPFPHSSQYVDSNPSGQIYRSRLVDSPVYRNLGAQLKRDCTLSTITRA